jgi:hypothetical protein
MKDKGARLLFSEPDGTEKKQRTKKCGQESLFGSTLNKIHSTKEREERLKILKDVAKTSLPWVDDILIQLLEDPSEEIRDFIIKELGSRDSLDLDLIHQRLFKPPWFAKTGCLKILGLRKASSSVEHMESLMGDPNIEVRRTLAIALGQIGDDKALALLAKLVKDSSSFVRGAARKTLQKAGRLR